MIWTNVSQSPDISLYPSLCRTGSGTLVAWYEYASPQGPSRSDVWAASMDDDGRAGPPVNLSGGISYNNGPCLVGLGERVLAGWHSWREPGREPFTPDGNISNIWLAERDGTGVWSEPRMALPELGNTRYAALTPAGDGLSLFFIDRNRKGFRHALSMDGRQWTLQPELPGFFQGARFPDVAWDGRYLLAFCPEWQEGTVALATSEDGLCWSEPRVVLEEPGVRFRRPKISTDQAGRVWITSHTEGWGERRALYRIHHTGGPLRMHLSNDGSAGNLHWTLNALTVTGLEGEGVRKFTFGPATDQTPDGYLTLRAESGAYESSRGYGFDGPVEELLRELGGPLTRSFVHAREPRTFVLDLPAGRWDLECVYSSWVASRAGTKIKVAGLERVLHEPEEREDEVHLTCLDRDRKVIHEVLRGGPGMDLNRPSKAMVAPDGTVASLAATRYGPDAVDIVHGRITLSW